MSTWRWRINISIHLLKCFSVVILFLFVAGRESRGNSKFVKKTCRCIECHPDTNITSTKAQLHPFFYNLLFNTVSQIPITLEKIESTISTDTKEKIGSTISKDTRNKANSVSKHGDILKKISPMLMTTILFSNSIKANSGQHTINGIDVEQGGDDVEIQNPHFPDNRMTQVCYFERSPIEEKSKTNAMNFYNYVSKASVWVDKSLLAKMIMKNCYNEVILITCPRKWGKSLNLNMLRHIFEKNVEIQSPETSFAYKFFMLGQVWIDGKQIAKLDKIPLISNENAFIDKYFQKCPVIYLDFKSIHVDHWRSSFKAQVAKAYGKHQYLIDYWDQKVLNSTLKRSERVTAECNIKLFKMIYTPGQNVDTAILIGSIETLSQWLYQYHQRRVFVFIDEFDALQNSAVFCNEGEYNERENGIHFMAQFIENTFKDPYSSKIEKGILTGILRVAKSTLLSGLNNIHWPNDLNLINLGELTPFYGFLQYEVAELFSSTSLSKRNELSRAIAWYDGYKSLTFCDSTFNPWAIMRYYDDRCLISYWENTGSSGIVQNVLKFDFFKDAIYALVYTNTTYCVHLQTLEKVNPGQLANIHDLLNTKAHPKIYEYRLLSPHQRAALLETMMVILCQAGYFTVKSRLALSDAEITTETQVELTVPNNEIRDEFRKVIIPAIRRTPLRAADSELYDRCLENFKQWFNSEVYSDEDKVNSHQKRTFEALKSSINELFKYNGPFEVLTSDTFKKKPQHEIIRFQHLSEAAVRRTLAPVLEDFRRDMRSMFAEERGYTDYGILDTEIFSNDTVAIIEYKSQRSKSISDVLEQAIQYARIIKKDEIKFKYIKFLAINFYKKSTKGKCILEMAQHVMTKDQVEGE